MDTEAVQRAVRDLETIRRAIERSDAEAGRVFSKPAVQSHLLALGMCAALTVGLLLVELFCDNINTREFLDSAHYPDFRHYGLLNVFTMLIVLLLSYYSLAFLTARRAKQDYHSYVARNFVSLRRLSLASDIFVKFAIFAAILEAGKPELVAPLFSLFLGDLLIEGRFFQLSSSLQILFGIACFIVAACQYFLASPLLVWPELLAAVISLASMLWLLHVARHDSESELVL
ncbi:MAG: hypothetical protein U0136_21780 [Bdellovibrionota bacterium]